MPTAQFPRDVLLDVLGNRDGFDHEGKNIKEVHSKMDGQSRWTTRHTLVFQHGDLFYRTSYESGSTENQDCPPWEHQDSVKCTLVIPVQKTITAYEPAP